MGLQRQRLLLQLLLLQLLLIVFPWGGSRALQSCIARGQAPQGARELGLPARGRASARHGILPTQAKALGLPMPGVRG